MVIRVGECGLTNSSSATEAGEDRLNHEKERAASLCSLERVVRLPAYRGASGPPERATTHRRGNDGRCRRERMNEAGDVPKGRTV